MNSFIEKLPVELFHRIFDNLDIETIYCSIRLVSKLFRSIVNSYDRYDLDLKLISKENFYVICRLINLQNIISLKLYNDNQTSNRIDLFINLIHLEQFTRLNSLTLINIDELQLNFILKHMKFNKLISFSFNIRKYDKTLIETTSYLLSSIIATINLRKLEFNIDPGRMRNIFWPLNSTIQSLTINSYINIDDLCKILQYSSNLHRLIMKDIPKGIIKNLSSIYFHQIKSLTIKDVDVNIDELKSFLLLTPSIYHFKLINGKGILDGKQWEEFIQINLHQLDKFEFYCYVWRSTAPSLKDIELIITSFKTLFWIEYKKWFINCECDTKFPHIMCLYSIPLCQSSMRYMPKSEKILLSTCSVMINNDLSIMNNINSLTLNLNKALAVDMQEKVITRTTNHPLFPRVKEIYLYFCEDWPLFSLQPLSIFINISQITQIEIITIYCNVGNQSIWTDIRKFMEQAHNLSSLIIHNTFIHKSDEIRKNIYSILPRHVKHLEISIDDLNQIKIILDRCKNLSTLLLNFEDKELSMKIMSWLADNTINTICDKRYKTVSIWLGKKIIRSHGTHFNPHIIIFLLKRINQLFRK